jgi:hypothetical protein
VNSTNNGITLDKEIIHVSEIAQDLIQQLSVQFRTYELWGRVYKLSGKAHTALSSIPSTQKRPNELLISGIFHLIFSDSS